MQKQTARSEWVLVMTEMLTLLPMTLVQTGINSSSHESLPLV